MLTIRLPEGAVLGVTLRPADVADAWPGESGKRFKSAVVVDTVLPGSHADSVLHLKPGTYLAHSNRDMSSLWSALTAPSDREETILSLDIKCPNRIEVLLNAAMYLRTCGSGYAYSALVCDIEAIYDTMLVAPESVRLKLIRSVAKRNKGTVNMLVDWLNTLDRPEYKAIDNFPLHVDTPVPVRYADGTTEIEALVSGQAYVRLASECVGADTPFVGWVTAGDNKKCSALKLLVHCGAVHAAMRPERLTLANLYTGETVADLTKPLEDGCYELCAIAPPEQRFPRNGAPFRSVKAKVNHRSVTATDNFLVTVGQPTEDSVWFAFDTLTLTCCTVLRSFGAKPETHVLVNDQGEVLAPVAVVPAGGAYAVVPLGTSVVGLNIAVVAEPAVAVAAEPTAVAAEPTAVAVAEPTDVSKG